MNEHVEAIELPELSDEDVELLYAISKRAAESHDPPFKALFAAYDDVFEEQQIQQEHDGVVFRYLMRVGESTRAANREGKAVDLVERLRNVLQAQGITVIAPSDDGNEDTESVKSHQSPARRQPWRSPGRRVLFDDARLEETWLSEYSAAGDSLGTTGGTGLLDLLPRRGAESTSERRARSTSARRGLPIRTAAPKHFQKFRDETVSREVEGFYGASHFDVSQTELEQNADAFRTISELRHTRHMFGLWREATVRIQKAQTRAYLAAAAHDRATLLKQAIEQWRITLDSRREDQKISKQMQQLEAKADRYNNLRLLAKSFTHWAMASSIERIRTAVAQRHLLKVTYFRRWHAIASANQTKARRILCRKYLSIWRDKVARKLLTHEQAEAHYEESLLRRYKNTWFWHFCSRRVETWHEELVERRTLAHLKDAFQIRRQHEQQAENLYKSTLAKKSLSVLRTRLEAAQHANMAAEQHAVSKLTSRTLAQLSIHAILGPGCRQVGAKRDVNLKRKTMSVLRLQYTLAVEAAHVDRQRILQAAWTHWNDALRCKALSQRIDERVLVENLYRWVLQERLSLFLHRANNDILRRAFSWWASRVQQGRDRLAEAEIVFSERRRRIVLASAMFRLNSAMRVREDAERVAVETVNSRVLPKAFNALRKTANDVQKLENVASDARFYFLATSTLRVWQARTNEHQHNRRREAYAQVRARLKIRLVRDCFALWRSRTAELQAMESEANRRIQARVADTGAKGFQRWQERTILLLQMNAQAASLDQQKLLSASFLALLRKHSELVSLDQEASGFRHDSEQALMAGVLKSVQWAAFTAARRAESAEALWHRNRQQYARRMLRHWAGKLVTAGNDADASLIEEPESPSLAPGGRVASRLATSVIPSSPLAAHPTPAYLRTPSRPRRAGRFRPLPTPALFTPMAFDSAYLVTTPAPLVDAGTLGAGDQSMLGLTPQVTPFERKLRAGGFAVAPGPNANRSGVAGPSDAGVGTVKSVRFAGSSRFGRTT